MLIIFIKFCCCLDHCQDSSVKKMGFLEVAQKMAFPMWASQRCAGLCNLGVVSPVNEIEINSKNLLSAPSFSNFLSPIG